MDREKKGERIPIDELIRSRRKTLCFIVDRDARLVVRAPMTLSRASIEEAVARKASWIRRKQAEAAALEAPRPRRYEEGEEFLYLGEPYRLAFSSGVDCIVLGDGRLWLPPSDARQAQKRILSWYRREARRVLEERTAFFAGRLGVRYRRIRLSCAKGRWGSCGPGGNLNFVWRLVMAPPEIVDYVVAHELCHILVPDHSAAFWARVESALPDYRQRRQWLRKYGGLLEL